MEAAGLPKKLGFEFHRVSRASGKLQGEHGMKSGGRWEKGKVKRRLTGEFGRRRRGDRRSICFGKSSWDLSQKLSRWYSVGIFWEVKDLLTLLPNDIQDF